MEIIKIGWDQEGEGKGREFFPGGGGQRTTGLFISTNEDIGAIVTVTKWMHTKT